MSRPQPDFHGDVTFEYAPHRDGQPDPGEIVWTWVPYEEDPGQGKDRPVLVIGRRGPMLLALMLTSKDHDRDPAGRRHWLDLGTGDWDARRRPSEVRLDRVLTVDPGRVRREGAALDPTRFGAVVDAYRALHGRPPAPAASAPTGGWVARVVRRLTGRPR